MKTAYYSTYKLRQDESPVYRAIQYRPENREAIFVLCAGLQDMLVESGADGFVDDVYIVERPAQEGGKIKYDVFEEKDFQNKFILHENPYILSGGPC